MKRKRLPVKWDSLAKAVLDDFCAEVEKESSRSMARKVRGKFIHLAHGLNDFPNKYPKEELLDELEGHFRSATIWSFKMVYEITDKEIIIVYLFHTSRHPGSLIKALQE